MKEYIEREAARRAIEHADPAFCYCIDHVPAADVAPVIHGKWIEDGGVQVCSNCGEEHAWEEYRATYCEDCGAKMDME